MWVCRLHREGIVVVWDDEACKSRVNLRTVENCCRYGEVATASSGRSGRDADEDCGALKVALDSMEDIGGNVDEEEAEFVAADVVGILVDVGNVKVDEGEETGADRRESSIASDWVMPAWKEDK